MPAAVPPLDDADLRFLDLALAEARAAGARAEVPIGAVVVEAGSRTVLARAGNRTEADADPTAHAEVLAIRQAAAARGRPRLPDCDLYVTLEPCGMCATAISFARIRRLIYACADPKMGGVAHGGRFFTQATCHHRPEVIGPVDPFAGRSAELLRRFFRERRR